MAERKPEPKVAPKPDAERDPVPPPDPVEESSQESFPASDAPAWNMGNRKRRKPAPESK